MKYTRCMFAVLAAVFLLAGCPQNAETPAPVQPPKDTTPPAEVPPLRQATLRQVKRSSFRGRTPRTLTLREPFYDIKKARKAKG